MRPLLLKRDLLKSPSSSVICSVQPSICMLIDCIETNPNFKFKKNVGTSDVDTDSLLVEDLGSKSRRLYYDQLHIYPTPDLFDQVKQYSKLNN